MTGLGVRVGKAETVREMQTTARSIPGSGRVVRLRHVVKQILRSGGSPRYRSRKGTSDPMLIWGRDLPALAKAVGLQTDVIDEEMLHTLKRNTEWAGRYPGPSGVGDWFVPRRGSDDLQRVTGLISRIRTL